MDDALLSQIRESYGRVVYSHKTHEKCAEITRTRLSRIKTLQIALSAASTAGFFATLTELGETGALFVAIFSALLLALTTYTKDFDLGEVGQRHSQAASELWHVREKYLTLLADLQTGAIHPSEARRVRDELLGQLNDVYAGSPGTSAKAYRRAQKALQQQEEMTFSDDELDLLLPESLRKGSA